MFIAILTYKKPLSEVDNYLSAHREYLAKHYAIGDFITSGPQIPRIGGVIMIKANNREAVDAYYFRRSVLHQRHRRLSDSEVFSDNVCQRFVKIISGMKVIGINGSARKNGNTAILIRTIFEELNKKGVETELIQLADVDIEPVPVLASPAKARTTVCSVKMVLPRYSVKWWKPTE